MREFIFPGEDVTGLEFSRDSVVRENDRYYAVVLGFKHDNRFIPLVGTYRPRRGDHVVGIVVDVKGTAGYLVDINTALFAFLPMSDTRFRLRLGDSIFAKIKEVGPAGEVVLWDIVRLRKGKIIEFLPKRVPRLIGKNSSMLNTLSSGTNTKIYVGANGYVHVSGGDIPLALHLIKLVEKKAHTSGLTAEVEKIIEENREETTHVSEDNESE